MKPRPEINETNSRRDSVAPLRRGGRMPKTDCHYHSGFRDFSGGGDKRPLPSIRVISEDYFGREARGHFATEAAFFALIAATVSVPLFGVLRGLVDWVL